MSEQDDYSLTFRERAVIEATALRVVEKIREIPFGSNPSWRDFWYSIAKGAAAALLGFIMLAVLWATLNYLKAGAPAVTGLTH